jgi:hypothetical protein
MLFANHLTLISDNHCYVVITLGTGREPRSLVFQRWRHVIPLAPILTLPRILMEQKTELLEYDFYKMFISPVAPMPENDSQFWHQTRTARGHKKSSNGMVHIGCSMVMSATIRSYQSREALADAPELARWNKRAKLICALDDSTWGNA